MLSIPAVSYLKRRERAREYWRERRCKNNLRNLALGAVQHMDQFCAGKSYPPSIYDPWRGSILPAECYLCPSDKSPRAGPEGVKCSYRSALDLAWSQKKRIPEKFPSRMMMVWESQNFHHHDSRLVAFFDWHVEQVGTDSFEKLYRELEAAIAKLKVEQPKEGE